MKVDGGIGFDLQDAARHAKEAEEAGYSGIWTAETSHDPVLPAAARGRAHGHDRARHLDRGRLRPQPDAARQHRLRPAGVLEGPLHARPRQPDQAAHHQAVLDAVEPPGATHAGADPGHAGDLGLLEQRHQARLPRRLLHPHADDAVLQPRPEPVRRPEGLPRRRRRADDRGRRRGLRRVPLPRVHHREVPARGDAARRSSAGGPRSARRWRASRSSARRSS